MKKIISFTLAAIICLSLLTGITFVSYAEEATVVADKGWENATYDVTTGILTNVDGGYSFKVNGSTISYNGSTAIEAEEVVIPSSYNGTPITTIDKYVINGGVKTTATKSVIISSGITTLNSQAFRHLQSLESIVIPQSVTKMGTNVFMAAGLTEVTIPDGVTTIDNEAFSGCTKLKKVNFGEQSQLKSINNKAFVSCTALEEISLPNSLVTLGSAAFQKATALKSINLGNNVQTIGANALGGCTALTGLHIPASVTTIDDSAIYQCKNIAEYTVDENSTSFKSVDGVLYSYDMKKMYVYPASKADTTFTIPDTVEVLCPYVFSYATNLTSITFPADNKITALPAYCFDYCTSLTDVKIPSNVISLGNYCFNYCSLLEELVVPKGVTVIPDYCFIWCGELKSLTFLGDISEIKQFACGRLYALEELTFMGKTAPVLGRSPFYSIPKTCIVYYPSGSSGYTDEAFTSQFNASQVYEVMAGAPSATNLTIDGSTLVGSTITGTYGTYSDPSDRPESGSTYVFETSANINFADATTVKQGSISAGEAVTYVTTTEDATRYIRFGVTPRNADASDNQGETSYAVLQNPIRLPETKPVVSLSSPYYGYKAYINTPISLGATATSDDVITKIEYYVNSQLVAQGDESPFDATWTPTEAGEYSVYAVAYNSLGESTKSGEITVKIYSMDESIEDVSAEKWHYSADDFTTGDVLTSETGLVIPGLLPPTGSIGTGVTVSAESGVYNKQANDYSLKIAHEDATKNGATLIYRLSELDEPVNNIMMEADIAVSSHDQSVFVFSYQTPKGKYNVFQIGNDGTINYYTDYGKRIYKKVLNEDGTNFVMAPESWHKFGLLLDFENVKITFYFDGEELETVDCPDPYGFTSLDWAQIQTVHNATKSASIVYVDDMKLYQVQDSYVTSVITSIKDKSNYLTGSPVKFEGYASDSRSNGKIDFVEIYANDTLINTVSGDTYSFEKTDLAPGRYVITAKAVAADGLVGYSQSYNITVSAIDFTSMITDNMILQRNKNIKLFGYGNDGATVTAEICGKTASATVANGTWTIILPPMEATKSVTLTFTASDGVTTQFNNVAIGEVLIVSGQSNIQYSLEKFSTLKGEADADYPDIRYYAQSITTAGAPKIENEAGKWKVGTQYNCYGFSAMGFLIAKDYYLANNCEVPVGVIYAAYGGSSITTWVPNKAFSEYPDATGLESKSTYFNANVAPWKNYTIGQVLWYQGESNTQLTTPYEHMLTAFIDGWRTSLEDPDLNMMIVMLPIYAYAEKYGGVRSALPIREAEWNVSERLHNVETVVAVDTGDEYNIHPSDKLPIAHRASLVMQHFSNPDDSSLVWKSPSFESYVYDEEANTITVTVKDVAGGLKTTDGLAPRGFKIAGDDGVFTDATVTLDGNKIIADTSSVIGTPMLRYAWEDCPAVVDGKSTINVVNSGDLPLAPFRTDRAVYRYRTRNEDGTYSNEVNFSPMVRNLTVSEIADSTSTIKVQAYDVDDSVVKTEIYCDNVLLGEAQHTANGYYTFNWSGATTGEHTFYAVATDSKGYTSINNTVKTVTPKKYTYTLKESTAQPELNLDGTFETGFTATSKNADGKLLVIACYNGNALVNLNISKESTTTLTAVDVANSDTVKAFILADKDSIDSVTDVKIVKKN